MQVHLWKETCKILCEKIWIAFEKKSHYQPSWFHNSTDIVQYFDLCPLITCKKTKLFKEYLGIEMMALNKILLI
jgi:hypothetical protein